MAIESFDQCRLQTEQKFQAIGLELQKVKDTMTQFGDRLDKQDKMVEDIQSLSKSVALLASNMDAMLREQQAQNARLQTLEQRPVRRFDSILDTVIKLVLTAAIGVILVKIGLQ